MDKQIMYLETVNNVIFEGLIDSIKEDRLILKEVKKHVDVAGRIAFPFNFDGQVHFLKSNIVWYFFKNNNE